MVILINRMTDYRNSCLFPNSNLWDFGILEPLGSSYLESKEGGVQILYTVNDLNMSRYVVLKNLPHVNQMKKKLLDLHSLLENFIVPQAPCQYPN